MNDYLGRAHDYLREIIDSKEFLPAQELCMVALVDHSPVFKEWILSKSDVLETHSMLNVTPGISRELAAMIGVDRVVEWTRDGVCETEMYARLMEEIDDQPVTVVCVDGVSLRRVATT